MYGNYEYGGSATDFTVMSADDTPTLAVIYRENQRFSQAVFDLTDESTLDLGTFDQGYPESWDDNLEFRILNLGGDGAVVLTDPSPFVTLSPDAALTLQSAPGNAEVDWREEFYLDLDTTNLVAGSDVDLSFTYDLEDGSGATLASGQAFTITLHYAVTAPQPQMEVRVEHPQTSTLEIIQDGGTWDVGTLEPGTWNTLDIYMNNNGNGTLEVSSVTLQNDASGQVSIQDDGPFSIASYSGDGTWLSVNTSLETDTYSVPVEIVSNDAVSPFTFTLQFEVAGSGTSILEYYPVTPGELHTYSYTCGSGAFPSGTRWQTFLDSTVGNRIAYTYTGPEGHNQASFISMRVEDGYFPRGYSSSGGNDFSYFRLLALPVSVSDGASFTNGWGTEYTVTTGTSWGSYADCIRVDFDTSASGSLDEHERGTGYVYLARNNGIVYYRFEHALAGWWGAIGDTETYEIAAAPEQLVSYQITGTVEDTGGQPLEGAVASLSPMFGDHSHYDATDGTGAFSFPMYYKAGVTVGPIYAGVDTDDNQTIELATGSYERRTIYDTADADYDLGTFTIYVGAPESIYSFYPSAGDTGVFVDQDIHIASRPADVFDLTSAQAAFSISPSVTYEMYTRWYLEQADTELTIELDDLAADTTYTVTFSTALELGGTPIAEAWEWTFTTGSNREFVAPATLNRPAFTMTEHFPASLSYNLTWDPVAGATEYEAHQSVSENFVGWQSLGTTTETTFPVTVDHPNQYYYRVRATDGADYSEWSRIFYIEPQP